LLRNLLLNGTVNYINDDFKGIDRTDDGIDATVGAKFLLRREIYLGASYTFSHRDSRGAQAGQGYSQNILMLRLATQL
ncbi:MAG: outer membrane beta-barrel protein, partial [Stellaceae bacterium]